MRAFSSRPRCLAVRCSLPSSPSFPSPLRASLPVRVSSYYSSFNAPSSVELATRAIFSQERYQEATAHLRNPQARKSPPTSLLFCSPGVLQTCFSLGFVVSFRARQKILRDRVISALRRPGESSRHSDSEGTRSVPESPYGDDQAAKRLVTRQAKYHRALRSPLMQLAANQREFNRHWLHLLRTCFEFTDDRDLPMLAKHASCRGHVTLDLCARDVVERRTGELAILAADDTTTDVTSSRLSLFSGKATSHDTLSNIHSYSPEATSALKSLYGILNLPSLVQGDRLSACFRDFADVTQTASQLGVGKLDGEMLALVGALRTLELDSGHGHIQALLKHLYLVIKSRADAEMSERFGETLSLSEKASARAALVELGQSRRGRGVTPASFERNWCEWQRPTLCDVPDSQLRLSYSAISSLQLCPMQFALKYVFRLPTGALSRYAKAGKDIHTRLLSPDDNIGPGTDTSSVKGGGEGDASRLHNSHSLRVLLANVGASRREQPLGARRPRGSSTGHIGSKYLVMPDSEWQSEQDRRLKRKFEEFETLRGRRTNRALGKSHTDEASRVLLTEYSFSVPITLTESQPAVEFVGTFDRVDELGSGDVVIREFKASTTRRTIDGDLQLLLYTFAYHRKFGTLPAAVSLESLSDPEDMQVRGLAEFLTSFPHAGSGKARGEAALLEEVVGNLLKEVASKLNERSYAARPGSHCVTCPFHASCPAAFAGPVDLIVDANKLHAVHPSWS